MFTLFGRSSSWKKVRKDFLRSNPKCAACGRTEDLEVHHIVPYYIDKTKELDETNLITLCGKNCHFVFGHLFDWKSWNEDVIDDCKKFRRKVINRPYQIVFNQVPQNKENKDEKSNPVFGLFNRWLFKRWNN